MGTQDAPAGAAAPPTLVEDLLLLLFQPRHGTIAGETTLYYVLGAAVLADLALAGGVTITTSARGAVTVTAREAHRPDDELISPAWEYLSTRPRGVQAVIAAVGPALRKPVLDRLIARGDIRRERRTLLRLLRIETLADGGTDRRARLLGDVRAALVDRVEPTPRTAALAALLWASGALPHFDPEIPWRADVIATAQDIARGDFGAAAAGEAVTRTMTAIVINSVIVATAVRPPA